MSICTPCVRLKDISLCTDSIRIGVVLRPEADYEIYFRSLATDATYVYYATSDINNILMLDLPNGLNLATGHLYEVWVHQVGEPIENMEDLEISGLTSPCYSVCFRQIYNDILGSYENYSLQIFERQ